MLRGRGELVVVTLALSEGGSHGADEEGILAVRLFAAAFDLLNLPVVGAGQFLEDPSCLPYEDGRDESDESD